MKKGKGASQTRDTKQEKDLIDMKKDLINKGKEAVKALEAKQSKVSGSSASITVCKDLKHLNLTVPSLCTFYASSGSGKTYYLKELLFHAMVRKDFKKIYIISPTAALPTSGWSEIADPPFLMEEVCMEKIEKLILLNKAITEKGIHHPILIILDDILGSIQDFNNNIFTSIATRLRHYNVSIWITSQYFFKLPCVLRSNAHMSFIFRQTSDKNFKGIYDEILCSHFNTQRECKKFIMDNTKEYGVICVDNNSNNIQVSKARNKPYKYRV